MSKTLVRYKLKDGKTAENETLVKAVYAELSTMKPAGFRYVTFRLDDGLTHFHLAINEHDANPLSECAAFKAFTASIKDRCDEPPQPMPLTTLGSFGFFD